MLSLQAFSTSSAAGSSPSHLSISAADRIAAIGFARFLPMMSKAAPCTGSNSDGFCLVGSSEDEWAIPMDPDTDAARSDRMLCVRHVMRVDASGAYSPCRLVVTIVSSVFGFWTMRTVMASTSILSHFTSGKSCATSAATSSHSSSPYRYC